MLARVTTAASLAAAYLLLTVAPVLAIGSEAQRKVAELKAARAAAEAGTAAPATPAAPAPAPVLDLLHLRNGDRLSGTLVDMFDGSLVFKAWGNDAIKFPWADVASLTTTEPYRVTLAKGGDLEGAIRTASDGDGGTFVVATPVGPVTVRTADVRSIDNLPAVARKEEERKARERFRLGNVWSGRVGVGLGDTSGNSEARNVNFDAEATRKSPADKIFLDGHYNRSSAAGVVSADAVRGGMRLDVNITKRRFYFLFGRLEVDKVQELDLRSTVGAGLGNTVYDGPRGHLDMGLGMTYVRDAYADVPNTSDRTLLFSLNWDRKAGRAFSVKERLLVYPNLEEFSDYRIESDLKFDYAIADSLSLTLGLSNRYDAEPLPGKVNHDMTITTALTKRY